MDENIKEADYKWVALFQTYFYGVGLNKELVIKAKRSLSNQDNTKPLIQSVNSFFSKIINLNIHLFIICLILADSSFF